MSDGDDLMHRVRELATGKADFCRCGWKRPRGMTVQFKACDPVPPKESVEVFVRCPQCGTEHRLAFK